MFASLAAEALALAVIYGANLRPLQADWLKMRWLREAMKGSAADLEASRSWLETAARLAPWEPQYRIDLGVAEEVRAVSLQQQRADAAAIREAFRGAEQHFRQAILLDPADLRARYALGTLYQFWGASEPERYADAARVYAEAAAMSPRRQRTYWLWGDLLLAQGKPDEAEAMYRRALELDPRVAAAHGAMAMLYERLGRAAEAEHYRQSAKALRPTALVIVPHAPPGSPATSTPIP